MFTKKDMPKSWLRLRSLVHWGRIDEVNPMQTPNWDKNHEQLGETPQEDHPRRPMESHTDLSTGKVEVVKVPIRRLDGSTCLTIRPLLSAAWRRGAQTVVIDMTEVRFIDSLGISALISEQRRRPQGTKIVVSSLGDFVRDVFEVTQLYELFDVFGSSDAAVASLAA
jgi:anti-sigma B factor antagonist